MIAGEVSIESEWLAIASRIPRALVSAALGEFPSFSLFWSFARQEILTLQLDNCLPTSNPSLKCILIRSMAGAESVGLRRGNATRFPCAGLLRVCYYLANDQKEDQVWSTSTELRQFEDLTSSSEPSKTQCKLWIQFTGLLLKDRKSAATRWPLDIL
jgi:hypothetical protein